MARIDRLGGGFLRRRIELQRKTSTPDGAGGSTKGFETYDTVFAEWRPLSGKDRLQAEQIQSAVGYRVLIRFKPSPTNPQAPFVKAEDRILYKGRPYNIRAVIDVEDRRRWLELDVESGVSP